MLQKAYINKYTYMPRCVCMHIYMCVFVYINNVVGSKYK